MAAGNASTPFTLENIEDTSDLEIRALSQSLTTLLAENEYKPETESIDITARRVAEAIFFDTSLPLTVVNSFNTEQILKLEAYLQENDIVSSVPITLACFSKNSDAVRRLIQEKKVEVNRARANGHTPLHTAVFTQNLELVTLLVESLEANIEAKANKGETPAFIACLHKDPAILKYLVEQGADVAATLPSNHQTLLHTASNFGNLEVVRYLTALPLTRINAITQENITALHLACQKGYLAIVKHFIEERDCLAEAIPASDQTALDSAAAAGQIGIVDYWYSLNTPAANKLRQQSSPLHFACANGKIETVRQLLTIHHLNVNQHGINHLTPLLTAILSNQLVVAQYLISEAHANVNSLDANSNSILHFACETKSPELLTYLLTQKLNSSLLNAQNCKGYTPLSVAAYCGQLAMVQALIAKGALIDRHDYDGLTPLHSALSQGHLSVAQYLIEKQAVLTALTHDGASIIDVTPDPLQAELLLMIQAEENKAEAARQALEAELLHEAEQEKKRVTQAQLRKQAAKKTTSPKPPKKAAPLAGHVLITPKEPTFSADEHKASQPHVVQQSASPQPTSISKPKRSKARSRQKPNRPTSTTPFAEQLTQAAQTRFTPKPLLDEWSPKTHPFTRLTLELPSIANTFITQLLEFFGRAKEGADCQDYRLCLAGSTVARAYLPSMGSNAIPSSSKRDIDIIVFIAAPTERFASNLKNLSFLRTKRSPLIHRAPFTSPLRGSVTVNKIDDLIDCVVQWDIQALEPQMSQSLIKRHISSKALLYDYENEILHLCGDPQHIAFVTPTPPPIAYWYFLFHLKPDSWVKDTCIQQAVLYFWGSDARNPVLVGKDAMVTQDAGNGFYFCRLYINAFNKEGNPSLHLAEANAYYQQKLAILWQHYRGVTPHLTALPQLGCYALQQADYEKGRRPLFNPLPLFAHFQNTFSTTRVPIAGLSH